MKFINSIFTYSLSINDTTMVVASLVTMRNKYLMVLVGLNFDTSAIQSFTKKHAIEPATLRMVQLLASSTSGSCALLALFKMHGLSKLKNRIDLWFTVNPVGPGNLVPFWKPYLLLIIH